MAYANAAQKHKSVKDWFNEKIDGASVSGANDYIHDTIRGSARLVNVSTNTETQDYLLFATNQAGFSSLGSNYAQLATNQISNGGQLPAGEDFVVTSIKFSLLFPQYAGEYSKSKIEVVTSLFSNAVYNFTVSNKIVASGILSTARQPNQTYIVPGYGVAGLPSSAALANPVEEPQNVASFDFVINPSVKIDLSKRVIPLKSQVPFDMKVNTGKVLQASLNLSTNVVFLTCELIGMRRRPVN